MFIFELWRYSGTFSTFRDIMIRQRQKYIFFIKDNGTNTKCFPDHFSHLCCKVFVLNINCLIVILLYVYESSSFLFPCTCLYMLFFSCWNAYTAVLFTNTVINKYYNIVFVFPLWLCFYMWSKLVCFTAC